MWSRALHEDYRHKYFREYISAEIRGFTAFGIQLLGMFP